MFTTLIVQPLFNLLVFIYALLPGHNFGLAVILFTVVIRILMWPLVKKQLHQTKVMRQLQPELKRIKAAAKGNRQKESVMLMELYKEKGISPFASLGLILLQLPIFIGLYSGLNRIVKEPNALVDFSYPFIRDLSWMKQLAGNIHQFDNTLFGIVDLTRPAIGSKGAFYLPAALIVVASAVMQYFQSKQLLPKTEDQKGLRAIIKEANQGKQADQAEVNAAVGRSTRFLIPAMILLVTVGIASALSLYWLVSGAVAFWQQSRVLREDETEMEAVADAPVAGQQVVEGEIVSAGRSAKNKHPNKQRASNKRKKRR